MLMTKTIEIELRSRFDEAEYNRLKSFLDSHAEVLGPDDRDVHFFILPDKLLKVSDNISQGVTKLVLKLNRIGQGSAFEEIELVIDRTQSEKAVRFCEALNITTFVSHGVQRRMNYVYKGVELGLKYSDAWGYHLELEEVVDSMEKRDEAEGRIRAVAKELGVHVMSEEELQKFEADYKAQQEAHGQSR